MTRTTAKYLAFLTLAIVLFYWKTLLTNQFTLIIGSEGVNQTYGWLHFWVNSLWHGHIPLWDPYAFGGRPFSGEMQPAAYYPFRLLFALFPLNKNGLISPRLFNEFLGLTHLASAFLMFALLRELRRSHYAAFVGACAFAMGGLMSRMSWPHYIESCIWLPAILLFLLRALRAQSRGRTLAEASLGGLCLGMSTLTGGVQFSTMDAIVVVTALVWYGVSAVPRASDSRWTENRAPYYRLAMIGAVLFVAAFGTGAPQLLPASEYGHISLRFISGGYFPMSEKIPYDRMDHGMWPESIVTTLFPTGFDGKIGGGETWPIYNGVFPFLLVVIAIWKCRSDLWVRYLAGLALIAFLYSLGEYAPLNGVLYALVPYLWATRQPSRFLYLVTFALAAASAFGLDALLSGAGKNEMWAPARPYLKWIAISCAIGFFLPAVLTQFSVSLWTCMSLLLILGSLAWFFRMTQRPVTATMRVLLAAFILFDLGSFNWFGANWNDTSLTDQYQQMLTLRQPVEFIKAQPGLSRMRVTADPEPNVGDIYAVQSLWGGGGTMITDVSRLMVREDLLNVRYHIKPVSTPAPDAIYQDKYWKVYEDKGGYPRAWLTHQAIVEPSHDAVFARIGKPGSDFHNVALIESPLPRKLDPNTTGDSVRFRSYEADSMSMDVNTAGTALLVVSEVFYPGWKATVNGQPAEIHKTDGALRGIVVPGGRSHVALEYVPVSFYSGVALSILTVGGVTVAWILLWRRRRVG